MLEDGNKASGLGQYSGLASMVGLDIGGTGGSGIFQGDNIIELYKSRLMLEKTLLSEVVIDGKKQMLIDRYIDFNKLRVQWKEKNHINNISFDKDPSHFTRTQDSIVSDIVELFNKKVLMVSKPDKKLSIIRVEIVSEDELFARDFTLKLVETVNNFYTQTKTKKSNQNVNILQRQADSVKRVLNYSITGVASSIDATPNANPLLLTLKVPSQKKQVDVQASTAIYAEIVKNLELSKISLRQEVPLIQVIDEPVLPLTKERVGKLKGIIAGGFLAGFLCMVFIICRKVFKSIMM
ncbi:lipopolysaccharide biosynthesis protein [Mucilaginibacter pocheonensis]|uniref:lipopolysaccharide biosynthesis protein n=1 Tax=Mucilaginibacter pocheonensis TaxID=398050 RepID=UPI00286AF85D|nr:lipopolysaccharide biosynthesis protein [Mucilaginibacter pocheonensis]